MTDEKVKDHLGKENDPDQAKVVRNPAGNYEEFPQSEWGKSFEHVRQFEAAGGTVAERQAREDAKAAEEVPDVEAVVTAEERGFPAERRDAKGVTMPAPKTKKKKPVV